MEKAVGVNFGMIGRMAEGVGVGIGSWCYSGEKTHGRFFSEGLIKTEEVFVMSKEGGKVQNRL